MCKCDGIYDDNYAFFTTYQLCLRPSTKITFSIKGDVPSLTLPIPIIFPLASSPKVTVPPS